MNRQAIVVVGGLAAAIFGLLFSFLVLIGGGAFDAAEAACDGSPVSGPAGGGVATTAGVGAVGAWKGDQLANAAAIINAGHGMGVNRRAQQIAVMTAMGESTLRVLDYGDKAGPDSRGLFQQRDSWGPLSVRMDPTGSAKLFYAALLKVKGWQDMKPTLAAHRTQINADPYHYDKYWDQAVEVVEALVRVPEAETAIAGPAEDGLDPYHLGPVTPQLRALVAHLAPKFGITNVGGYRASGAVDKGGHPKGNAADFMVPLTPAGRAQGDRLADYAMRNAKALGIDYIIWYGRIWNSSRDKVGAWRSVADRGSPTANHHDHPHINVIPNGIQTFSEVIDTVMGGPAQACETVGSALSAAVVYPLQSKAKSARKNWRKTGPNWARWHTGEDFSVPCGTPVYASHAGKVVLKNDINAGPYMTQIVTGAKAVRTDYWHMQTSTVTNGQQVQAGDKLGEVGTLGNSTGCHLHFEVHAKNGSIYDDDNVSPLKWLAANVGKALTSGPGFVVAQLNVLGASHTAPGGSRASWPNWEQRLPGAVRALNAAGAEIATLQEFQPQQARGFLEMTDGSWTVFPKPAAKEDNIVAWRTDRWIKVNEAFVKIPYFGGQERKMPYVLLQSRTTGKQVWVGSFHNPANVHGPAGKWRREATRREAELANKLQATAPVIFAGDMNEEEPYFCQTIRQSSLRSASGGTVTPCRKGKNQGINWLMGSQVLFTGYKADWSLKDNRITDHPLVTARAQVP